MLRFLQTKVNRQVMANAARVPARQLTQKDQDEADDKAREDAIKAVVQSWIDRLQLITVITTFFASTEAGLVETSDPKSGDGITRLSQFANGSLIGALIVHVFAAIVSFFATSLLINYKVKEANREEELEQVHVNSEPCPTNSDMNTKVDVHVPQSAAVDPAVQSCPAADAEPRQIWSSNPHLQQVGPFCTPPPLRLLERCHTLCIIFTFVGLGLALIGTVCFAWERQSVGVSVFATTCVSLCFTAVIGILL